MVKNALSPPMTMKKKAANSTEEWSLRRWEKGKKNARRQNI
jgi:hypothetical protein